MTEETITLYVSVSAGANARKEDLDELVRELGEELTELDSVKSVEPVQAGRPPDGAKGLPIDFGTIMVKLAEVGGISNLITVLGSWLSRDKSRTLKLQLGDKSLEVTGLSRTEQQELIQWFKAQPEPKVRHSKAKR